MLICSSDGNVFDDPIKPYIDDGNEEEEEDVTSLRAFLNALNPINTDEWSDMKFYSKFYEIFKVEYIS